MSNFISSAVVLQFAESDYESNEEQGRIVTLIQRLGSIATDLVFRVVLRNYTQVNVSGVFLAEDIPAVPNFDEDRPNIAKSKLEMYVSCLHYRVSHGGGS